MMQKGLNIVSVQKAFGSQYQTGTVSAENFSKHRQALVLPFVSPLLPLRPPPAFSPSSLPPVQTPGSPAGNAEITPGG